MHVGSVQLLVGLYMLIYLGLICRENMQIEGFWYYLFTGVFEAATIHYAVAKIFGPLLFGRGWCGYACWTAMVLDFLPYKKPQAARKKIGFIRYITFAFSFSFVVLLFLNSIAAKSQIDALTIEPTFQNIGMRHAGTGSAASLQDAGTIEYHRLLTFRQVYCRQGNGG